MSGDTERGGVQGPPRIVMRAAVALALFVIIAAGVSRLTGSATQVPQSTIVAERLLRFVDREDGGVTVVDAATAAPIVEILPASGGFIRGSLRALVRERRAHGIGAEAPFRLVRWADGRLTLDDPATRVHLELDGFGSTNVAAYAALLDAAR